MDSYTQTTLNIKQNLLKAKQNTQKPLGTSITRRGVYILFLSSDEKQENEYDGINELMGNLAPYDYEALQAISSSSEKVLKMKLLVEELSCPVQYGQLENLFQRQMDSVLGLKMMKDIDQMHTQYIKLKHYNVRCTLNKVLLKFHCCNFPLETLIFVFR